MEKKKIGSKKKIAAAVVLLAAVVVAVGIFVFRQKTQNVYSNNYYSIALPEGWTAEVALEKSEFQKLQLLSAEGTTAAWIEVRTNFKDGWRGTYSFLYPDRMGMHGSMESEEIILSDDSKLPFYRVIVTPGLSAAEQSQGVEPYPDKLYYMYINDESFLIYIEVSDDALWDEMERVVKSMKLK